MGKIKVSGNGAGTFKEGPDLRVELAGVEFINPLWVASGTFGYGEEYEDFVDLSRVGAVVTKTITAYPREGNPPPRVVETPSGLLNSIGLENKGADDFIERRAPYLRRKGTKIIASIAGETRDNILECLEKLERAGVCDAYEVNLSCPNVQHGGTRRALIAQDAEVSADIIKAVKCNTGRPVLAKLTPNVTDITETALAVENAGADMISLVNTYMGMAVDILTRKPLLGNVTGGLSGPAIKPLALKSVWDVYKSVDLPLSGIGGIMNGEDAAEFFLCGASTVQVGTANLVDPDVYGRILNDFKEILSQQGVSSVKELTGKLET
jgi:dihydroorotate dehydrogenase (NAD+) catalytic subunit